MKKKSLIASYIEMTKPSILMLVLVTVTLGYYLGGKGIQSWTALLYLLFGVGCMCGGAGVLNHYLERDLDAKMIRTRNRPLPTGRIQPSHALIFALILTMVGLFILYVKINILTAFLSLLTTFMYIVIYTPMKRYSWLNTTIGAFPGAMPPLGGWAAATGTLNFDAGMLFLILFVWQHPHFYAIAWMCKEDYASAGFKMLPCVEPDGKRMFDHALWSSMILIPISILPVLTGISGYVYCVGAIVCGFLLLGVTKTFFHLRTVVAARSLLGATVIYLPVLLILIILDLHLLK